jgi:hypothetical protein
MRVETSAPETSGTSRLWRGARAERGWWADERRWSLGVFAVALVVFLFVSLRLIGLIGITGDEPWYLLQAYTLTHFHTVDLARAIHDPHIYGQFLGNAPDDHIRDFRGNGVEVMAYLPGYAALIGPLYALGGRGLIVFAQALAAAATATLLFGEAWRLFRSRAVALFAVAAYLTCLPTLVYAGQIFPSTLATLVSFAAYLLIARVLPQAQGQRLIAAALGLGLLLGILPWLHVKYAPLALVAAGAALALLWLRLRAGRDLPALPILARWPRLAAASQVWLPATPPMDSDRRVLRLSALAVGGLTLLNLALVVLYSRVYFGTWYPQYRSGATGSWVAPDFGHMLGLYGQMFFDPQSGLIPWAPLLALAVFGLALLLRRRPREGALMLLWLAGLLSAFLSAAFAPEVKQAFAMPARFTVESQPFLALAVAGVFAVGWPAPRYSLQRRSLQRRSLVPSPFAAAATSSAPPLAVPLGSVRALTPVASRFSRLPWASGLAVVCLLLLGADLWLAWVGQLRPALLYPSLNGLQIVVAYPHLAPTWWFGLFGG